MDFFAKFNVYTSMAMYLAEKLHMRPNDILFGWGVPELIVAYGHYANEDAQKIFNEWKNLDQKTRGKIPKPPEYVVKFVDLEGVYDD